MFGVVLYRKTTGDTNATASAAAVSERITHDTERFPHSYISVGAFYNKVWNVHDVGDPDNM
jgi:hypothetical protein